MTDPIRISSTRRRRPQVELFDTRGVTTLGAARYWVGDFFEGMTAAMMGADRLVTDGRFDICPDAMAERHHLYFESKSVGNSGSCILYECRINKDRVLTDAVAPLGWKLRYVVWRHTLPIEKAIAESVAVEDLHAKLAKATKAFCVVEFEALETLCKSLPVKVMNTGSKIKTGPNAGKRLGYGSKGYGPGWNIPFKKLCEIAFHFEEVGRGKK